jgi:16S rRNA processing protein RimM
MSAPQTPPGSEGRLVVGLVRGLHGLRGMVRVEILTDNPDRFAVGSTLYREGDGRQLTVASAQRDGPGLLVKFREIGDRNAAESLRDTYLEAVADEPAEQGAYFWHDIVGCAVTATDGRELGTVADVFRVGEGEVYVVRGPRGEILVPAVASVVTELNPADKRMVVDAEALGLDDTGTSDADA